MPEATPYLFCSDGYPLTDHKDHKQRANHDWVQLLVLFDAATDLPLIQPQSLGHLEIQDLNTPNVITRAYELMAWHKWSAPGPFKKSAALLAALMKFPLVLYRDKAESQHNVYLWSTIAMAITRVYLANAQFERNGKRIAIKVPRWPSTHFREDFRRYVAAITEGDKLDPLAMMLELLMYNTNTDLAGCIDHTIKPPVIPGIDIECDQHLDWKI